MRIYSWVLVVLIVTVFIIVFFLYPTKRCRGYETYLTQKSYSNPLYKPDTNQRFTIHPEEAAYYYSTTGFPAYLCSEKQRYCYN